jgi:hypothetical protein
MCDDVIEPNFALLIAFPEPHEVYDLQSEASAGRELKMDRILKFTQTGARSRTARRTTAKAGERGA